jgi:type I restriction enzyme S subunit
VAPETQQKRIVAEIEKQFSRLDEAVDNLKRVKANLKRYKASVLKAAVEGKLTEEWRKKHPDVEPADKLLQRILAERRKKWEKAELVKMKAKGKEPKDDKWKKKYKEPAKLVLDDLPILPKEWIWVAWEAVLSFDKSAFKRGPFGSALKKSIFVESGYKVYEQYCPINDDCSFARYFITDEKYKEIEAFAVKAGDFLISCSGTLGRITQVPDDYEAGVINQALLRIRVNNDAIYDVYFKMLFRSPYFQKQILANTTGSAITNVKGVNELKAIPLPLPTLEEQRAIIAILEEYMSVISVFDRQVDKNIKRADRLRQSVLKNAFSGKLIQSKES